MASIPEPPPGTTPGEDGGSPPDLTTPTAASRTLADMRQSGLSAAAAVATFDGILAELERLEAAGLPHPHIDAQTVLVSPDGEVVLAGDDSPAADGASTDIRNAARLVSPVVATGGRRFQRIAHLLEAIIEGRAAAAASDVRAQLATAATPLGAGWNDPGRLAVEAALPTRTAGAVRRRSSRRRLLWGVVALVLVAGVVSAILLLRTAPVAVLNRGPLGVGRDAALHVRPASGGCNTTFTFEATGSVSGVGSLTFRWEQSDGNQSDVAAVAITAADGSFDFTQAWRLEGSQSFTGTETFHLLTPVDRTLPATFQYHCP